MAKASHSHAAGDITSGVLPVTRGGTGLTAAPSVLINLNSTSAVSILSASPRPGVTGTLPVARGGTGVTTLDALKTALGFNGTFKKQVTTKSVNVTGSYNDPKNENASGIYSATIGTITANIPDYYIACYQLVTVAGNLTMKLSGGDYYIPKVSYYLNVSGTTSATYNSTHSSGGTASGSNTVTITVPAMKFTSIPMGNVNIVCKCGVSRYTGNSDSTSSANATISGTISYQEIVWYFEG